MQKKGLEGRKEVESIGGQFFRRLSAKRHTWRRGRRNPQAGNQTGSSDSGLFS